MCTPKKKKFLLLLGESYYPVFHITDFSSASSSLLLEPLWCTFLFSYHILQLCEVCLVLSYTFYLFIEVLAVFIPLSSSVSIFITITLISLLGKLSLFHNSPFSDIVPCSSIWNILLFLHFAWLGVGF